MTDETTSKIPLEYTVIERQRAELPEATIRDLALEDPNRSDDPMRRGLVRACVDWVRKYPVEPPVGTVRLMDVNGDVWRPDRDPDYDMWWLGSEALTYSQLVRSKGPVVPLIGADPIGVPPRAMGVPLFP